MGELYKVRCTHAPSRGMAGMYAAGHTTSGMVATWNSQRAAVHTVRTDADDMAARLARSFSGTVWAIEAVGVGQ
ncbi:hypothetical protein [Rhodoferax sp.]|uniref:hypothetical protein n=1 Tax=Rhodoferax sp. TaxID=50421 RepID=UPI0026016A70|nr:hypothetical protein [Rhodoferax sp.]MDD5478741.1 hypothetical protein [Rhodoferax sp.]